MQAGQQRAGEGTTTALVVTATREGDGKKTLGAKKKRLH